MRLITHLSKLSSYVFEKQLELLKITKIVDLKYKW